MINQVMLVGRLTKTPELFLTENEKWKNAAESGKTQVTKMFDKRDNVEKWNNAITSISDSFSL